MRVGWTKKIVYKFETGSKDLLFAHYRFACVSVISLVIESTAHVLNGCQKLKNNYSKRHDGIVEKLWNDFKSMKTRSLFKKQLEQRCKN